MKYIGEIFFALLISQGGHALSDEIQEIDPSEIIYTTSTIANELPPLTEIPSEGETAIYPIHEDDWSQIEFLHPSQLLEVQKHMEEYSVFEAEHRREVGWQNVYLRDFKHRPILTAMQPKKKLLDTLNAEESNPPIIHSASVITGLVKNGFSVNVGPGVVLYGYTDGMKVRALCASLGENPSNEALVSAFSKLNAKWGLVLVDWRSKFILTGVDESSGQIEVWHPE